VPVVVIGGYIGVLWASYKSETITSGSAYGFSIGSTMVESAAALTDVHQAHSQAVVYVSYGPSAGDHFTVPADATHLHALRPHEQWDVLLDCDGEFSNTVRLTSEEGRLASIYRHRQYFELP
ncbi:hypothetical protein SNE32_16735, partial [Lysobacter sp. D1-1-M9]|uniref:hypothetical protein n=1 Tax=Novilysobacter longmucuonensis TaxID=3098603 RepID=UPI002FCB1FE7